VRVFLLALGSRGDVELFLTLGRELRRRGHFVRFGSHPSFAGSVEQSGLSFVPAGIGSRDDLLAILRRLDRVTDLRARTLAYVQAWLRPQVQAATPVIQTECAAADYFASNLKMAVARSDGSVMPCAFVTYDPPGDVADLARYRPAGADGRVLELAAFNRRLVDPGGDWGPDHHFTGFWFDEYAQPWVPPAELVRFLDSGPAPIVLAMGSAVMADADRLSLILARALARMGRTAVVVRGWSNLRDRHGLGEHVHVADEIPYSWLLRRASCVIHHGGCGTIAHALRAGIPSIILPQISAQHAFAAILAREGLAIGPLDASSLDVGALSEGIDAALDAPVRAAAARWREIISADRGTVDAAERIEGHVHSLGLT
jgi:sterol 3beta-glucosyltransferase